LEWRSEFVLFPSISFLNFFEILGAGGAAEISDNGGDNGGGGGGASYRYTNVPLFNFSTIVSSPTLPPMTSDPFYRVYVAAGGNASNPIGGPGLVSITYGLLSHHSIVLRV
jgi:hypothetical protein